MTATSAARVHHLPPPGAADLDAELRGFMLKLQGDNRSRHTLSNYAKTVQSFRASLIDHGRPLNPDAATRADVLNWRADMVARHASQNTLRTRVIGLRAWFKYLQAEGVRADNPTDGTDTPTMPDPTVAGIDQPTIDGLWRATAGRDFASLRDRAMLALTLDAGLRRSELTGIDLDADLNMDARQVTVYGKGSARHPGPKMGVVGFGQETALAIHRYLRVRNATGRRHANRSDIVLPGNVADRKGRPLWLRAGGGGSPALGPAGFWKIVQARAEQAGVGPVHPHQLRHTWADALLSSGHHPTDVMRLGRWSSMDMVQHYAAYRADERARANYRSPLDGILRPKGTGR